MAVVKEFNKINDILDKAITQKVPTFGVSFKSIYVYLEIGNTYFDNAKVIFTHISSYAEEDLEKIRQNQQKTEGELKDQYKVKNSWFDEIKEKSKAFFNSFSTSSAIDRKQRMVFGDLYGLIIFLYAEESPILTNNTTSIEEIEAFMAESDGAKQNDNMSMFMTGAFDDSNMKALEANQDALKEDVVYRSKILTSFYNPENMKIRLDDNMEITKFLEMKSSNSLLRRFKKKSSRSKRPPRQQGPSLQTCIAIIAVIGIALTALIIAIFGILNILLFILCVFFTIGAIFLLTKII